MTSGKEPADALELKAVGCLAGAAVGDALGGSTEGRTPEQIRQRYGGVVTDIVGPYLPDWQDARPASPYHKGDGHITDDTLMTRMLVKVYDQKRDHLDAYDVAERLVPLLTEERLWIPELERVTVPLQRIFLAEKWLVTRLQYGHVDPREAGVGNIVNCGAAMYMAPVGIVNAGNPDRAYAEAIDIAGAHQSSYGREAAGVFAAAVAAAMTAGATVADVVATCLRLAKDGTRPAIEAVCDRAAALTGRKVGVGPGVVAEPRQGNECGAGFHTIEQAAELRTAMEPFDTVGVNYREPGLGARRPSRLHAIEELPLALAMLVIGDGDFTRAVLGGVNYGRDSDSIATMAGAISGALNGSDAVPAGWRSTIAEASRFDLDEPGRVMAEVARETFAKDADRAKSATAAFNALLS